MKYRAIIFSILVVAVMFNLYLSAESQLHILHTVDGKKYEGKMVAFKFDTIYFNVYKFGKVQRTIRFPLYKVWKIDFNAPKQGGLESSFEVEQNYDKLRRGKRTRKITLEATAKWMDTNIDVKVGQDILFSAVGSIYIDKDTEVSQNGEMEVKWNTKKPMANQPTGAIIGRVGKKGQMFYIGSDKAPFHMAEKGRLYIGVNDFDHSDNFGKFTITVYY